MDRLAGRGVVLAGAWLAAGCTGPAATIEQLMARATFELQCPAPQIQLQHLDESTKGVRGCGKQLTYVELCDNRPDGWRCTWVINSPAWWEGPPGSRQSPQPPGTWWWTKPQPGPEPARPGQPQTQPAPPHPPAPAAQPGPGPSGPPAEPPIKEKPAPPPAAESACAVRCKTLFDGRYFECSGSTRTAPACLRKAEQERDECLARCQ